jgi:uncharacterized protein (UPF0335 family)
MPEHVEPSVIRDLAIRTDNLVSMIERLEKEIKEIKASGIVAPRLLKSVI